VNFPSLTRKRRDRIIFLRVSKSGGDKSIGPQVKGKSVGAKQPKANQIFGFLKEKGRIRRQVRENSVQPGGATMNRSRVLNMWKDTLIGAQKK